MIKLTGYLIFNILTTQRVHTVSCSTFSLRTVRPYCLMGDYYGTILLSPCKTRRPKLLIVENRMHKRKFDWFWENNQFRAGQSICLKGFA